MILETATEKLKVITWESFLSNKKLFPKGVTVKRLEKLKFLI